MGHRAPLTAQQLAQIWDEHPDPVVLELLWEIHRLRATIGRADQVRKFLEGSGQYSMPGTVWECFTRELDAEPCLTDRPTKRQKAATDAVLESLERARKARRQSR